MGVSCSRCTCARTAKEEREMQLALAASLKSANQMEVDQTGFGLSADEMYGLHTLV